MFNGFDRIQHTRLPNLKATTNCNCSSSHETFFETSISSEMPQVQQLCVAFIADSDQYREAEYHDILRTIKEFNEENNSELLIDWKVFCGSVPLDDLNDKVRPPQYIEPMFSFSFILVSFKFLLVKSQFI